jgi:small multidrug resistance pump
MRLPPYALLAIAIVAEVIATSALRASEGFSPWS